MGCNVNRPSLLADRRPLDRPSGRSHPVRPLPTAPPGSQWDQDDFEEEFQEPEEFEEPAPDVPSGWGTLLQQVDAGVWYAGDGWGEVVKLTPEYGSI